MSAPQYFVGEDLAIWNGDSNESFSSKGTCYSINDLDNKVMTNSFSGFRSGRVLNI